MTDALLSSEETALLTQVLDRLDGVATRLDRIDALLTEFEPVIRAYLDPAASGPVAWAVRKRLGVNNGKS
jgi:hypothetical protein